MVKRRGLWANDDFLKLWAGESISVLGTLIGKTALPFTAILVLDAGAFEVGLLVAADILPAMVFGLFAGVWADRLRRRPLMIAADVGSFVMLVTVPVAYAFDVLTMGQLFLVAFGTGAFHILFDVSYNTYLPTLVKRDHILEANSKMAATWSLSEVGGFSAAGVLVQVLTAPFAILFDAVSFLVSAVFIGAIRYEEKKPEAPAVKTSVLAEIRDGARALLDNAVLRAMAASNVVMDFSVRVIGSVYLLYATRELGFEPALLGFVFAVGGLTSLPGAIFAGRAARRFGIGPSMVLALMVLGSFSLLTPAARDASVLSLALLVGHQFGDFAWTMHDINQTTLRQSITPERYLGRVNAGMRFSGTSAMLAGALAGGVLGEVVGLRATLIVGSGGLFAAAAVLALSPVWGTREMPPLEERGVDGGVAPVEP
ncbi:MAG TPA: MFS transporter [Dehalococcoidia bacterium]|nr:MFS transporter [Dehalococcoidia bacterium]